MTSPEIGAVVPLSWLFVLTADRRNAAVLSRLAPPPGPLRSFSTLTRVSTGLFSPNRSLQGLGLLPPTLCYWLNTLKILGALELSAVLCNLSRSSYHFPGDQNGTRPLGKWQPILNHTMQRPNKAVPSASLMHSAQHCGYLLGSFHQSGRAWIL